MYLLLIDSLEVHSHTIKLEKGGKKVKKKAKKELQSGWEQQKARDFVLLGLTSCDLLYSWPRQHSFTSSISSILYKTNEISHAGASFYLDCLSRVDRKTWAPVRSTWYST
jgi:hypothetical protein